MKTIQEGLKWRYATLQFDSTKKVSESDLNSILEAGNLMPTSFGLQPFHALVVTNQKMKDSLLPVAYNQKWLAEASHLIVLAVNADITEKTVDHYMDRIVEIRGVPKNTLEGIQGMMNSMLVSQSTSDKVIWAKKQAYLALGGMIAAASIFGVDSHAAEGFDPAGVDKVLNLGAKGLTAAVLLAIGHRHPNDQIQHSKKVRLSLAKFAEHIA